MIIQRIASAIRRQDWFQVLIEIFIVVIGIFLGLQVQEWNEDRQERAQEGEYLNRLHQDIVASITRNEITLETFNQQEDYAASMLNSLRSCELDDAARLTFTNGLNILGKNDPAQLVRDVLEDLKSTGNFKIIQNRELREEVTAHTARIDQMILIEAKIYERIGPSIRYLDQNVILNITAPTTGIERVAIGDIDFDFEKLCQDIEAVRAISHIRGFNFEMIDTIEEAIAEQQGIKTMIEDELERF